MTVRAGVLARVAAGAIAAAAIVLPGLFATAQQIDMNVVDQPGYQPSPDPCAATNTSTNATTT